MAYLALAWLGALVLMAHSGVAVPDGFGLAVLGMTLWSLVYLYVRLCRRWPIAGWLAFGFLAGLFGWSRPVYVHTEVTVDAEAGETYVVDDDNCDYAADETYYDGGGSSDSRGD